MSKKPKTTRLKTLSGLIHLTNCDSRHTEPKGYTHPDNRLAQQIIKRHKLFDRCHAQGVRRNA